MDGYEIYLLTASIILLMIAGLSAYQDFKHSQNYEQFKTVCEARNGEPVYIDEKLVCIDLKTIEIKL